jgi:hypothetical protein
VPDSAKDALTESFMRFWPKKRRFCYKIRFFKQLGSVRILDEPASFPTEII